MLGRVGGVGETRRAPVANIATSTQTATIGTKNVKGDLIDPAMKSGTLAATASAPTGCLPKKSASQFLVPLPVFGPLVGAAGAWLESDPESSG
ncbi:MAG: hypothetical protein EOR22_02870 [Mesorhizobium sp.]|nr:MAG: hypothetical protein EOR22_02870 [Mesorhizobium sp.]